MSGARSALAFLTPVGGAAAPTPEALSWFPVVGAAVGLGVGTVWWIAGQLWPAAIAAALALVADLALTGMLHMDGLCDSADGLLAPMTRERRLEVMAAPDIGAFGTVACVATLLLRWAALTALHPSVLLVAALWAASRTWMTAIVAGVPYARPGGLATAFGRARHAAAVVVGGTVVALAAAVAWRVPAGPAAIVGAGLGTAAVVLLAWRRIGGFTGDVLGAAGVVGETLGLIVASAKW